MRLARIALFSFTIVLGLGCAGMGDHGLPSGFAAPMSDQAAVGLIEQRCSVCHSTNVVYGSVGSEEEWSAVVARMMYHHKAKLIAHVTDREAADLAAWLATSQKPTRSGVRIGFQPTGRPL